MSERLPERAIERLAADAAEVLDDGTGLDAERYQVLREVGRGGMGIVYEAVDRQLGRRVALKVLAAFGPEAGHLRERLLREARAAARLAHPNIAAVYDASDRAIALEFVPGAPLAEAATADLARVVRLLRDAARAVHHAHEHGIVHRDLKPQNLLVDGERVVVTDFGLAKELRTESSLSLSGQVLGTPAFMAPEQAAGRHHEVDARSDVYALGATLFAAAAGRPPFVERDLGRLLRRIEEDDAPLLSSARGDVPRDLARVVAKCLAKERELRYSSARALAEDLDRWLAGRPVAATAPGLAYRAAKLVRRHRAAVAFGLIALAAIAGVAIVAWGERTERAAASAALALAEVVEQSGRDAAMHERLGETGLARESLARAAERCREFLERRDSAYAWFLLGRVERSLGQSAAAGEAFAAALERDPTLAAARRERGLLAAAELFQRLAAAGEQDRVGGQDPLAPELQALRSSARADLDAAAAGELGPIDRAAVSGERARLAGDFAVARRCFEEALRLDPLDARARVALAQVEVALGDGDAAWRMAMSAFDLHRGFGPAYLAQSRAYSAAARGPSADAVDRAAARHELTAAEAELAAGGPTAAALLERGGARLELSDVDGALADFSAALAEAPDQALAYCSRALVHARRAAGFAGEGRADDALSAYSAAIADCGTALELEPELAGAYNNRGVLLAESERLLFESGRTADASAARERARRDFDGAVARAPRFALAYLNRAMLLRREAEAARAAAREGEFRAALAAASADVGHALELAPDDADARVESALLAELGASAAGAEGDAAGAARLLASARADFDRAVAAAPDDARVLGLRGLFEARTGDRAAALRDLDGALARAPDPKLERRLRAEREHLSEQP